MDVWLHLSFVRCAACHDNFDSAFSGIIIVPFWFNRNNRIVEIDTDFTAHRDNHGFAGERFGTRGKVIHQVLSNLLNARFSTGELFKPTTRALSFFRSARSLGPSEEGDLEELALLVCSLSS